MTIEIPPPGTRGISLRALSMMRAFNGLSVRLYRLTGGRLKGPGGLLLTTVGARSGRERSANVAHFPDGDNRFLIVGSFGGAARHPAWFINLAKNPDQVWAQLGRDRFKVRPDLLEGEERADAWRRIVAAAPAFAKYEQVTDREIPVVRLTREPSPDA
ncbi:MAG: nitroreductase/quinone reductase family protein [Chloroflexota bacterium]